MTLKREDMLATPHGLDEWPEALRFIPAGAERILTAIANANRNAFRAFRRRSNSCRVSYAAACRMAGRRLTTSLTPPGTPALPLMPGDP